MAGDFYEFDFVFLHLSKKRYGLFLLHFAIKRTIDEIAYRLNSQPVYRSGMKRLGR